MPRGLAFGNDGQLVAADAGSGLLIRYRPPQPPRLQVADNPATNRDPFGLRGSASAGTQILVVGGRRPAAALTRAGTFEVSVSLQRNQASAVSVFAVGSSGNGLASTPASVRIIHDDISPMITAHLDEPANAAGWHRRNVGVQFTCADDLSGVAACPPGVTVASEGAGQKIPGIAIDRAGNVASVNLALNIDKTPPSITASQSPVANPAGWNKDDVSVTFACVDALSGVASCPFDAVITREGANQQVGGEAMDVAGNAAPATVLVSLDKTPPEISARLSPPANAVGWNRDEVTVGFTCTDNLSPVVACSPDVRVSGDGADQRVTGNARDAGGNVATATATVNVDRTPPSIVATLSSPVNDFGWHNTDTTVTFVCADDLSGIVECRPPQTRVTEGASQPVDGMAIDRAGNQAKSGVVVSIDKTAPSIVPVVLPAPNAGGWNNTDVTLRWECTDGLSGVRRCQEPPVVQTAFVGQPFVGLAEDFADNTATASVTLRIDRTPPTITVALLQPPNANGWNNEPVTAHFTCDDADSGIASCPPDQIIRIDGNANGQRHRYRPRREHRIRDEHTVQHRLDWPVNHRVAQFCSGLVRVTCNDEPAFLSLITFICSVPLIPGTNSVVLTATDTAGNTRASTRALTYVRVPKVTIASPAHLSYLNISPTSVTGTVDDPTATVTVNSIPAAVADGQFSIALPLAEGPNIVTASAGAGAVGTSSVTVTLDTTPPHVTITSPPDQFVTTDEVISVAGIINDIVVGTVNAEQAQVAVNGSPRRCRIAPS